MLLNSNSEENGHNPYCFLNWTLSAALIFTKNLQKFYKIFIALHIKWKSIDNFSILGTKNYLKHWIHLHDLVSKKITVTSKMEICTLDQKFS